MLRLYKSRAHIGKKRATLNRADAGAIHIKDPRKEDTGDNEYSGCRGIINPCPEEEGDRGATKRAGAVAIQIKGPHGEKRATLKSAGAEAIQINGPQRKGKGDNEETGCRG